MVIIRVKVGKGLLIDGDCDSGWVYHCIGGRGERRFREDA